MRPEPDTPKSKLSRAKVIAEGRPRPLVSHRLGDDQERVRVAAQH